MYANTIRRVRTVKTREWVVINPDLSPINFPDVMTVYAWARQEWATSTGATGTASAPDDAIKIRGDEDGSVIVSIEIETTENEPF